MNKKLKPFDLQAALSGEPVMLRDGTKAYVRHHETEIALRLIGYREDGYLISWCMNGNYYPLDNSSVCDIVGMWPKTRSINGFEVPVPESGTPDSGSTYFVAHTLFSKFYDGYIWRDYEFDKLWLERGLVFLTKEDAIANSKAMLGINPYEEEKE